MKQRIRAEAHGSSPSARSIRTGDLTEEMTPALALAEAAAGLATVTAGAATVTACPATATAGPATAAR
jgi:plasmid stability protein